MFARLALFEHAYNSFGIKEIVAVCGLVNWIFSMPRYKAGTRSFGRSISVRYATPVASSLFYLYFVVRR